MLYVRQAPCCDLANSSRANSAGTAHSTLLVCVCAQLVWFSKTVCALIANINIYAANLNILAQAPGLL